VFRLHRSPVLRGDTSSASEQTASTDESRHTLQQGRRLALYRRRSEQLHHVPQTAEATTALRHLLDITADNSSRITATTTTTTTTIITLESRGVYPYLPMSKNAPWSIFFLGGGRTKKFNIKL